MPRESEEGLPIDHGPAVRPARNDAALIDRGQPPRPRESEEGMSEEGMSEEPAAN